VPLADGRALVTGGTNPNEQSYSSTYIYDPRPGHETWTKAGLLGTARSGAAAAVLADGRVLVVGGFFHLKPSYGDGGAPGAVLAAYRPGSAAGVGSPGPRIADIEPPNIGAALATAEIYDPATDMWSVTGSMHYARVGAEAVTLDDGRVLVVGSDSNDTGVTVDDLASQTAEIYDPGTGRFSLTARLPTIDRAALEKAGVPHANPVPDEEPNVQAIGALVAVGDGGAVLIGHAGYWKHAGEITRSFRYDATADRWTEIGTTYIYVAEPTATSLVTRGVRPLVGAMVARLPDGRILVAGGAGGIPEGYEFSNTYTTAGVDIYDPSSDTWTPGPPMPEARAGAATAVLVDGSVLLAGGYSENPDDTSSVLTTAIRFIP
jgi:Galactose oxidase, central domain/Kelch motif